MSQPNQSESVRALAPRERQALYLAGEPMTSAEIARVLGGISPHTVDGYCKTACRKLGVSDRRAGARLVRAAAEATPGDWLAQTLGEVSAAATVLDRIRRNAETEAPVGHHTPIVDARGGRNDPPSPGRPEPVGDGAPPLQQPESRSPDPNQSGGASGAAVCGGCGGSVPANDACAPQPRGGPHVLGIPPKLRHALIAAVGAPIIALMIIGLLLVAIQMLDTLFYGPR